jgi:hypothetical protein
MDPVRPAEGFHGSTYAELGKNQPQYQPLPCFRTSELVMTEWTLSENELAALANGGRIRMWTYVYGHPFQPVQFEVVNVEKEGER